MCKSGKGIRIHWGLQFYFFDMNRIMKEEGFEMENMYRPGGKDYLHVNDDRILKIDSEYIEHLKSLARNNSEGKCMMCLHNDIRENFHELVSVYPANIYLRPHKHSNKTETTTIVEGRLMIVIWDSEGEILEKYVLDKNGIFATRLDKGTFHSFLPLTDVVFYEAKTGPFTVKEEDSLFPGWAPNLDDEEGIKKIMDKIMKWG